ncbi:MAG: DUF2127 domain-containing protein [Chloroflexi bacterium]|nr:MAG: DUF2127 domain-containing protein [Chloroflexota bacterium]
MTFWQKVKRELGRETQPVDTVVRLIILERGIRGTLVAVLGVALLTSSRGIVGLVRGWVAELNVNPERRLIPRVVSAVLRPIGEFSSRTVLLIGIGAILFGALELTEAVGLARRRRWAEYLTVIAGCIGIPFEIMEVLRRQTPVRISILLINVATPDHPEAGGRPTRDRPTWRPRRPAPGLTPPRAEETSSTSVGRPGPH